MSKDATPPPLSRIARDLPASGIRRFFDIAAQMEDVISLGVGEPDFATPWGVREAAIYSLKQGQTTYTSNYGDLPAAPARRAAPGRALRRLLPGRRRNS